MIRALEGLLADGPPSADRIDRFLREHSFPLVDGRSVTFVWRGEADSVNLRHWIFGLSTFQPLRRIDGTGLWHLTIEIPERSRVEYKLEIIRGEQREWIMDPLNPRIARDPFGANSVCHGEGYATPEWALPDPVARPGRIEELAVPSRALEGVQRVDVYLPARFRRTRRYPLLVVHDGDDYLRYSFLKTVLDNLIHRLEIAPLIVALTGSSDRLREYGADPRHAAFLADELLPHLQAHLPLIHRPESRGLLGASFGAVASLHAAWQRQEVWGRLLLQSGSFVFSDIGDHRRGPVFDAVVDFVNQFRERPGRPASRIFLSCGVFEPLIYENRTILPLLQSAGIEVRYEEARDGHNWENWRDRLRAGLSWTFPGPLWMVYE